MRFFEHFFQTDEIKKQELTKIFHEIDMSDWNQVFSACLGKMMVIQSNARDYLIQGRGWRVDYSNRGLYFGDDEYKIQYIGNESNASNTWTWGWEHPESLSEEILVLSNEMYHKGNGWNLKPLFTSKLKFSDSITGEALAIVSCGLSEENYFYHRCPYTGGAVYLAVEYAKKDVLNPVGITLFGQITLQCVKQYHINHKIFVESLLQWNKTPYKWNGDVLIAKFPQELFITFNQIDDQYRIISMNTK